MDIWKKARLVIVPILACFSIMVISFRIVILHMMIEGTDYLLHGIKALDIFQYGIRELFARYPYPIWHIGVKFFERIVHLSLFDSAAWMTSIIYGLTYICIFYFLKTHVGRYYSDAICGIVTFIVLIIQPITSEGLFFIAEPGRNVFNSWHNPTNIVARLFGIMAFFYFCKILEDEEKEGIGLQKYYMIFSVMLCLANLGKPSFSQVFLPAIVIYCMVLCIKSRFVKFRFCFNVALSVIPSLLILGFQVLSSFDEEGQGIEIAWFDVMRNAGKGHPLVILGTIAFPLYVTVVYMKECVKEREITVAWLMYGVGFLEYAALAEKGVRRYHGNFGWGYSIAVFMVHMVCIIKFLNRAKKEHVMKSILGFILLGLHMVCGCTYLYLQLSGVGIWY